MAYNNEAMASQRHKYVSHQSKRAEIFKALLPHIDAGNFCKPGGFWIFGTSSPWEALDELSSMTGDDERHLIDSFLKALSDLKVHDGKTSVESRVSLGQRPELKATAFDNLSPEQRDQLRHALIQLQQETPAPQKTQNVPSTQEADDSIDAAIMNEVLHKQPKIFDKVIHLDELNLDQVTDVSVKRYFQEAHRCYLYGFNIAFAVLCRALLEASLEAVCDPQHKIKNSLEPKKSYFKQLVEKAKQSGILSDDRPRCAIDVKNAGDEAIHDLKEFTKNWQTRTKNGQTRLHEILLNTRKILIDLYQER